MRNRTIGRVKESFRNFLDTISNEFHFPVRVAKQKTFEVSWPQSVVKTVEAGTSIERPVEIQNAHERLIQQGNVAGDPRGVERHGDQQIQLAARGSITNNYGQIETVQLVEGEGNVLGEEIIPTELDHDRTSIHTTSVQEWMSEPRASWRQSAPRMRAIVSKLRPMKPEIRQLHQNIPTNVPQITQAGTGSPSNQSPVPKRAIIELPGNLPSSPHSNPPPTAETSRSEPLYPRPIAVKRDAWRYSVDAVAACDRERAKNNYSGHGQGFVDLQPMKTITDPTILEKVAKLRRNWNLGKGLRVDSRKTFAHSELGTSADQDTRQEVDEFRQRNAYLQRRQSSLDEPNQPGHTTIPAVNRELPFAAAAPSSPANQPYSLANKSSIIPTSTPPVPNPLRTPRHQPSSLSSNIRTPKSFYPPDYEIVDRVQVHVSPIETKAEMSKRGRGEVLERWTAERLQERRLEGRGVEAIGNDGGIWRTADVIFGKVKLSDGPPIIREIPPRKVRPLHPLPIPTQSNGIDVFPPASVLAPVKAPVRQNSPVNSSSSDLLSTSAYPQRIPEEAQHLPPPPSRAIVPHRNFARPQPIPHPAPNGKNTENFVKRQPGPWDIRDLIYPPKPHPLSAEDAQELLYKFIGRLLYPVHEAQRESRLEQSEMYFSPEQRENEQFNSEMDKLGYIIESYRSVEREGMSVQLTTLNHIYLLRLIVTEEFIPYPVIQKEIYDHLQLFRRAWPVSGHLGLRPLGMAHFMHEDVEIMVFLSTEDDTLYLWSHEWDHALYGRRMLIRAGGTIDDCEIGIVQGLHMLEFENGGWLKIEGYDDECIGQQVEDDEDIYGCATGPIQM